MFKRPRLSCHYKIVNAALAASLVFLAACGDKASEETEEPAPLNLPSEPVEVSNTYEIQAVWATDPLPAPIVDLAFTGGSEPLIAAVFETGQLQLFTVQADRISDPIDLGITAIGTGQAVILNEVALTLFPGIGQSGALNFYAHAPALGDPVELPILPDAQAAGLCAGPPLNDTAIMQLSYWQADNPDTLLQGHIIQDGSGEPIWETIGTHTTDGVPITACTVGVDIKIATRQIGHTMASISKYGQRFTLALTDSDLLTATNAFGGIKRVEINRGITVQVPEPMTAMAALSNVQFGNYPDGLIVIAGPVDGRHQITMVEPGGLYRPAN